MSTATTLASKTRKRNPAAGNAHRQVIPKISTFGKAIRKISRKCQSTPQTSCSEVFSSTDHCRQAFASAQLADEELRGRTEAVSWKTITDFSIGQAHMRETDQGDTRHFGMPQCPEPAIISWGISEKQNWGLNMKQISQTYVCKYNIPYTIYHIIYHI